jgi:glycosyltransferase involved in cell wall biosynthesis
MRIAFLCKRRYMSKDVIVDRYARLYEIPFQLARLGHDVRGWCLSYGNHDEGEWEHDAAPGRLHWESRSLGRWKLPSLLGYSRHLARRLRGFKPDVIIGASDIPHVVLGARLANRLGIPYAADLYDNFEGFGQARIPGFVPTLRHAVRDADLVTTTSEPLADFVRNEYHARGKVIAMPSTVDKAVFHSLNRIACRRALGLPEDVKLIGTAGGLLENRGIGDLYQAWSRLAATRDDVHLVLAGPADPGLPPPADSRVHYLGLLLHADTAKLFAALDVGVIYLRDTPFGRYCFPQKAFEMLACDLPIVATSVGVMPDLLASTPQCLYRPGDIAGLAESIAGQLSAPVHPEVAIDDWATVIGRLQSPLQRLVARRAREP